MAWQSCLTISLGLVQIFGLSCWMGSAVAAEPEKPGRKELVILNPGIDETGLPAVLVNDENEADIPATVHVHRYYYSGDKEFVAEHIDGGLTIVKAIHPVTGVQCEVRVVLPPGVPTIAYDNNSITYVYPDRRVKICFSRFYSNKVKVLHLRGKGICRTLRASSKEITGKLHEMSRQSKLVRTVKDILYERKDLAKGAVGVAQTVAETALSKANQFFNMVPGVQMLRSAGENAAESQAVEEIRQAGFKQARDAEQFVKTIR